ncbi:hypothetical protein LYSHEL_21880 [Lysobacter helvus]|uniref:DUF998 domain-containing protein n=2 Tax=Lysobacteraceae TaxID=32033 RepID=A0ABM7Q737_9GAMM|nr:hypothetical protein LYSCAS_21890 [Lysobacter caseinilyticus]BCT96317.1 hypothetical protein LYSHEL_21880 [Lysobacter helvus]
MVAAALHGLRSDLDWSVTPLSFYLVGAHGAWLKAAYLGLALSIAIIGVRFRTAMQAGRGSSLAPWLFGIAALALAVTALAETHISGHPWTLPGRVHAVAAPMAFLAVTLAMVMQSWRMRSDPHWLHRYPLAFALALVCFAGLWLHAFGLDWPRGVSQRCLILLIVAWLAIAGRWLRCTAP